MNRSVLLTIDGIINLTLGILLILLPAPLVEFLGIPVVPPFLPNILGGVLIGIALFVKRGIRGRSGSGLGLDGAIAINLCAWLVLAGWLVLGDQALPSLKLAIETGQKRKRHELSQLFYVCFHHDIRFRW